MNKGNKVLGIVIAIIVVVFAAIAALDQFITDFMWFKEMGYIDVFLKKLVTQVEVGVPVFVVVTALVFLYLTRLRKSYFKKIASSEQTNLKRLGRITVILSLVFALFATVASISQLWFEILKFANSSGFDIADPLFHLDVSFYIFKLEFLSQLNTILIGVIVGFIVLTALYYAILMQVRTPDIFKDAEEEPEVEEAEEYTEYTGNNQYAGGMLGYILGKFKEGMNGQGRRPAPSFKPKKELDKGNFHELMSIASGKIALLGVIFFLMVAVDFFLRQFDLLHTHTGVVYGAGFTDVNIVLWMYRVQIVLSVIAAIMFAINIKRKQYKKLLTVPVIMIIVGLVGTGAEYLVQNFIVSPDEINKEAVYLQNNIEYTQYAYGLDSVDVKAFAADNTLTAKDITDNAETINNIRINDFEPAKQFYNQTQSIRQYYTFNDVDNDRYVINGKYTQSFLTAREIDESKISSTWLNVHLKYTHGYGVALSRVDKVTNSGQPDVLIGNIPPESKVDEITIDRPEIYFGELSNEYVVVGTDELEFDYPDGDSNAYNKYEGTAGIKMSLFNRILFSIREGSLKLLVSSNIDSNSKIIINRNVVNRVQTIMPYLAYEGDPYMVTCDGKLYWMMDAYTMSSYYPYSEPYSEYGTNYIRNSVKVVVDAYNGDVNFYIVDENDPIAETYSKIFPTLFKPFSEMPEGLQSHIRYPNILFGIQAKVYAKYHMEDVNVFYQSEDLWDIAYEIYGTEKAQISPTYYIAKLPGEKSAEFFNSIPFTPRSKQNMTALMIARNDGEHYGELVLYQFPKSKTIYGPEQIEAQIDQNTEISKEFTLWSSAGTTYRRGNLFVIPINTSILYVEPVYLEAQNSSIPEVKRIIVAYKDQIAYEETLGECLIDLFGSDEAVEGDDPSTPEDNPQNPTEGEEMTRGQIIEAANKAYTDAMNAQRAGDWAKYGECITKLGEYLAMLED